MRLESPRGIAPARAPVVVALPDGTTIDSIHAQVQRILEGGTFATSERHCRLLRYLLEQTLEGRAPQLKEYVLAVEVLGRGESFDPQTDAIVRTELSRLRARLTSYYASEGRTDPLVVELPKRSYSLAFRLNSLAAAHPVPKPGRVRGKLTMAVALVLLVTLALLVLASRFVPLSEKPDRNLASVAVLPFVNLSADPQVEHFSNGLTDHLIDSLAEIDGLRVISRTGVMQFKNTQEDLQTIAARLRVATVLEGSVRRSGNRLRITARLINAREGHQLISTVYERGLEDVVGVQEAIARHVANTLRIHHAGKAIRQFTTSAKAYDLYLQGRHHFHKRSESEIRKAIYCYHRAIAADPDYAPAHAGLADSYTLMTLLNEARPGEAMQRARQAAQDAVRTGDALSHAHSALGSVLALYDRDWTAADKEFRRALELDPNDSAIREAYAMRYLLPQGYLDTALVQMQLAQSIDPFSAEIVFGLGKVHLFKRDPERAVQSFQRVLQLDPGFEMAPLALSLALVQMSRLDQARDTLHEASAATEDEARLAVLGQVYALSREPDRAREVLRRLAEISRHQYVSGYYFALIHLGLGETSKALAWLEKALAEGCPLAAHLRVDPQLDRLRGEPRFSTLLGGPQSGFRGLPSGHAVSQPIADHLRGWAGPLRSSPPSR